MKANNGLPPLKFEIFDAVAVYRTEPDNRNGNFQRTTPTGEIGTIIGYAITDSGWEYFIRVDATHMYHKWVRELGLELK